MALTIRGVEYFKCVVKDRPGEAYQVLARLSGKDVNLLVFSAIPLDSDHTELVLFPEDGDVLTSAAEREGLVLTGPQRALLIQGDDHLGALADVHARLVDRRINVYASSGVTDGRGGFGYVIYVRPEDYQNAANALGA